MSGLSPSQQPTVLSSIYQNNTWTSRRSVDETNDPATQHIKYIEDYRILCLKKDTGAGLYQEDFDVSTCERDRISDGRQRIHGCYASRNNMHTIIFRKFRPLEF